MWGAKNVVSKSLRISVNGLNPKFPPRAPVGVKTLAPLWEKLVCASALLDETLDLLHREHLLSDDPGPGGECRFGCHPILRDHFRRGVIGMETFARHVELASRPAGSCDRCSSTVL